MISKVQLIFLMVHIIVLNLRNMCTHHKPKKKIPVSFQGLILITVTLIHKCNIENLMISVEIQEIKQIRNLEEIKILGSATALIHRKRKIPTLQRGRIIHKYKLIIQLTILIREAKPLRLNNLKEIKSNNKLVIIPVTMYLVRYLPKTII